MFEAVLGGVFHRWEKEAGLRGALSSYWCQYLKTGEFHVGMFVLALADLASSGHGRFGSRLATVGCSLSLLFQMGHMTSRPDPAHHPHSASELALQVSGCPGAGSLASRAQSSRPCSGSFANRLRTDEKVNIVFVP